ncbi:hypothetical protein ACTFIW_000917 [Dictyostelium discoideum]
MTSTNTLSKKATLTSASDGAIAVQAKSKKTPRPTEDDDDVYTTESTDVSDVEVKEKEPKNSKTNSIETKTIDALKNVATCVIFMNLFTIHCTQNGVDPTLKTIMDNGAASNELLQLLQPTHNESVKNNDKIEGETLKKLIHRNFRSKTLVPVKTDYEAAKIKVVDAISNRNCYSAQYVIKNIEAIMSYNNVINPVYLIHGTHEVQLEYLRSILDSNILALLKMVVPDWLQTDVAIKLNTQTDITECREAITELVLNNADKFSRRRPSNSASNAGEKSPMKKDHAVPNHNSHSRNHHDAQAEKIRADTLPKLQKGSKVDLQKVRSSFIVYRESKGHCLNCGKSNHQVDTCGVGPVDTRVYPDYDFPVNKDSLYTLNSFYNHNMVSQLYQQSQQYDVHKNINKLKEYVKDSYGIKLVPDTTVPIPKAVESEMKYKPQKIEFNIPTELTNVDDKNYIVNIFNHPKRLNSKHKPPLAFSTINGHRSMLNQLLLLKNQTDIVNDPCITRIMTGIHKLRPSSAKYQEIWDANQVFKYLSTIKVIPKYTYTALLEKTLVLCKMFGLARSSDLVKWSFNGLIITPDSIKGPVVNAKEQRKGVLSILELTSLDDTNSQVCPVRHLSTYLRASKGRRKPHSGDSVFIQNEGKPLDVKEINIIVLSTLSSSGIDISKFKSHSTRSAMASLLLSNNVPFHVVKKMGRWKSNDTVDTFYDKRIIGEKSGGFLNTVVQIS